MAATSNVLTLEQCTALNEWALSDPALQRSILIFDDEILLGNLIDSALSGSSATIEGLSDVEFTALTTGDTLIFNGTVWANQAGGSGSGNVTTSATLTDNYLVRGNGVSDIDIVGDGTTGAFSNAAGTSISIRPSAAGTAEYVLTDSSGTAQNNWVYDDNTNITDLSSSDDFNITANGGHLELKATGVAHDISLISENAQVFIDADSTLNLTSGTDTVVTTGSNFIVNTEFVVSSDGQTLSMQAILNGTSTIQFFNSSSSLQMSLGFNESAGTTFLNSTGTLDLESASGVTSDNSFTISYSSAGSSATSDLTNTSTAANSDAIQTITTASPAAGDPFTRYTITSGTTWSVGADNDSSDSFKISNATSLGTNDHLTIVTGGTLTTKSILPATDASFALGSASFRWTDVFLDSDINYIGPLQFVSPNGTLLTFNTNASESDINIISPSATGVGQINFLNSSSAVRVTTTYDEALDEYDIVSQNIIGLQAQNGGSIGMLQTGGADTDHLLAMVNAGTNGGFANWFLTDRTPIGNITGDPGDLVVRTDGVNSEVFQHIGASADNTSWSALGLGGGNVTTSDTLTATSVLVGNGGVDLIAKDLVTVDASGEVLDIEAITNQTIAYTLSDDAGVPRLTISYNDTSERSLISSANELFIETTSQKLNFESAGEIIFTTADEYTINADNGAVKVVANSISVGNGTGFAVEQVGNGDARMSVFLTGGQRYVFGIDNSSADAFKIHDGTLAPNSFFNIETTGFVGIGVAATTQFEVRSTGADTVPVLALETTGTNGARVETLVGTRDPEGNVTANPGDIYRRSSGVNSDLLIYEGATPGNVGWVGIAVGSGNVSTSDVLTNRVLVVGQGTEVVQAADDVNSSIEVNSGFDQIQITPATAGTATYMLFDDSQIERVKLEWDNNTTFGELTSTDAFSVNTTGGALSLVGFTDVLITATSNVTITAATNLSVSTSGNDTDSILTMTNSGTNGETTSIFVSDRDPFANVTGSPGDIFVEVNGVNTELHIHTGASASNTDWDRILTNANGGVSTSDVLTNRVLVVGQGTERVQSADDADSSIEVNSGNDQLQITPSANGTATYMLFDDSQVERIKLQHDNNLGTGSLTSTNAFTISTAAEDLILTAADDVNINPTGNWNATIGGNATFNQDLGSFRLLNNSGSLTQNAGMTIEQQGIGDAVLHFDLTGVQDWTIGINNSNANTFGIRPASSLSSDASIQILVTNEVGINKTPRANHCLDIDTLTNTVVALYDQKDVTIEQGNFGSGNSTDFFFNRADVGFNQQEFHLFNDNSITPANRFFELNYTAATGGGIQIRANGDVGIGTSAPTEMLHLVAETTSDAMILIEDDGAVERVRIGWDESTAVADMEITGSGADYRASAGAQVDLVASVTTGVGNWDFRNLALDGTSNVSFRFGVSSGSTGNQSIQLFEPNGTVQQTKLSTSGIDSFINAQGGMLGLGTSTPTTLYHIVNTGADTVAIQEWETTGTNAGTMIRFVGDRDPDGNVTGAGGDEYYRDDGAESGSYESLEATTGTTWFKRSINPSTIIEIHNSAQFEALASAGVITITVNTAIIFKTDITTASRFETTGSASLRLMTLINSTVIYVGTGTFFTTVVSLIVDGLILIAGAGGTLLSCTGGPTDVVFFANAQLIGWKSGSITRSATESDGPGFIIDIVGLFNWDTSFACSHLGGITINALTPVQLDDVGVSLPVIDLISDQPNLYEIFRTRGRLSTGETLIKVDPNLNPDARVQINSNGVDLANGLFETAGTSGTFTSVADTTESGPITSVTDNGGQAVFNHAEPTIVVNTTVVITGFSAGNSGYNGTFLVTVSGASTFETGVAFVAGGTGSFTATKIDITATAHGLVAGDTIVLDTDLSTDYDGGFLIFDVSANAFDVAATFTTTHTGTFDSGGIDQTDPRVLAFQNPLAADSHYIGNVVVNGNTTTTVISSANTYVDLDLGNNAVSATNSERWKVIDDDNGTIEYTGNEPYSGAITGHFSILSPGSQNYQLKYQKSPASGGGFVDLPDGIEVPYATDSATGTIPVNIPITAVKGDQFKPLTENIDGEDNVDFIALSIGPEDQ